MVESSPLDRPDAASVAVSIDWPREVERHAKWLRTIIRSRLGEWDAVDDVFQEVSSAVVRNRQPPTNPEKVSPWLYRIALRQTAMYRRTAGRRRKLMGRLAALWGGGTESHVDPLDWLMGQERTASVRAALSRLNPIDRDVFVLKHTENWTYQELAQRLGCTVHTIEHRLLKTRQILRKELAALGVTGAAT